MKSMIYELLTSALAFISMLMIVALLMVFGGVQFPNPSLPDAPKNVVSVPVQVERVVVDGLTIEIE